MSDSKSSNNKSSQVQDKKGQYNQMFTNMLIQGGINAFMSPFLAMSKSKNFEGDVKAGIQSIENSAIETKKNMQDISKNAKNFMGNQVSTLLSRGVGGGDIGTLIQGTENIVKLELQELNDNWSRYSQDIIKQVKTQAKAVKFDAVMGFVNSAVQLGIGTAGYLKTK